MEVEFELSRHSSIEQPTPIHNVHNSMIFERHVEEQIHMLNASTQQGYGETDSSNLLRSRQNSFASLSGRQSISTLNLTTVPTNGSMASINSVMTNTNNPMSSTPHHHRHLENFVAPVLDASASIVNDASTHLNDIDMVVPQRSSSTLGLDLALGRSRSYSTSSNAYNYTSTEHAVQDSSDINLTRSYSCNNNSQNISNMASVSALQIESELSGSSNTSISPQSQMRSPLGSPEMGKVLKCYSYADVLIDEMADNSNAHLQTHPSQVQLQRNLSTPFIIRRDSNSSMNKRVPTGLSRSPPGVAAQQSSSLLNLTGLRSPRSSTTKANINLNNPLINASNFRKITSKFQIGHEQSDDEEDIGVEF